MNYSLSDHTLRLSTTDGGRFIVDRVILAAFSPIFETMFEDATDTNETLTLVDAKTAWTTVLDVAYGKMQSSQMTIMALEAGFALANKYEMKIVSGHLFASILCVNLSLLLCDPPH